MTRRWWIVLLAAASCSPERAAPGSALDAPPPPPVPRFEPDPTWPLDLPARWVLGPGTGIWVDGSDHVWALHRPERIVAEDMAAVHAARDATVSGCCEKAPPLIELDPSGHKLRTLGSIEPAADWPLLPHGVFLDHNGFLWVGTAPHQVIMKFDRDGKRVLTLGEFDRTGGSADTKLLGGPADFWVDPETNELFVADGYDNRRIIVFDAATGAYLRHWGAYGAAPDDDYAFDSTAVEPPKQFDLIHGLMASKDGLIYVTDASNSRVQVFRKNGEFVAEKVIDVANSAPARMTDVAFSNDPAQTFLYVADGTEDKIWILRRSDLEVVGELGTSGTGPGQFGRPHNLATDSQGNLYVAEAHPGRRFQKLKLVAIAAP